MIALLGWLATVCFVLSTIPQTIKTIDDKHAYGLTYGLLLLWFAGLVLMDIYTILAAPGAYPLIVSYTIQIWLVGIMIYYKIFPKG